MLYRYKYQLVSVCPSKDQQGPGVDVRNMHRKKPRNYGCCQALLQCEAPRRGSSMKSSSKVATKVMRGVAVNGPRRTNDLLYMVASLGQPATTLPELGPPFEPTNDISKVPSSDNKPAAVSLVAQFDG